MIENNDRANISSLDYIVNNILAKLGLPQGRYYQKFLQLAVNGYREMNLVGVMPNFRKATLKIDPLTNSALLPRDYVDYLRIGVTCQGYFINYDLNDEIVIPDPTLGVPCPCDAEAIKNTVCNICAGVTTGLDTWYWSTINEFGTPSPLGGNFGLGPGFYHGGYRINRDKTAIFFDTCVTPTTVTLEYKSNGFDNMGDALVPESAIPALTAFVDWKRNEVEFERTGKYQHRDLAQSYNRQFAARLSEMNSRDEALNKHEWLRIFRMNTYGQVKN